MVLGGGSLVTVKDLRVRRPGALSRTAPAPPLKWNYNPAGPVRSKSPTAIYFLTGQVRAARERPAECRPRKRGEKLLVQHEQAVLGLADELELFGDLSKSWLLPPPVRPRTSSACWRWRGRAPRWLCPRYCLSSPSLSARARRRRRTSPAGVFQLSRTPSMAGNTACPALQDKAVELHGVGHFFLGLHVKPVGYALQVRLGAVRRHAQIQVGGIKFGVDLLVYRIFHFLVYFHGSSRWPPKTTSGLL